MNHKPHYSLTRTAYPARRPSERAADEERAAARARPGPVEAELRAGAAAAAAAGDGYDLGVK